MRIDGLTAEQVEMLDKLWTFDTVEEINEFKKSLPLFRRQQIDTLVELVIMETAEAQIEQMASYPQALELIMRAKNR